MQRAPCCTLYTQSSFHSSLSLNSIVPQPHIQHPFAIWICKVSISYSVLANRQQLYETDCKLQTAVYLQAQRCYYGSVAEFLTDCQALVDAAAAYNTIGRGGSLATPGVVAKARGVFEEGQRLLKVQRDEQSLDYWCKRVEVSNGARGKPNPSLLILL